MAHSDTDVGILHQHGYFNQVGQEMEARKLPTLTIGEMLAKGAMLGLGAAIDRQGNIRGEITVIGGHAYVTLPSGKVEEMQDSDRVIFAQYANLPPEGTRKLHLTAATPDELMAKCKAQLPPDQQEVFALNIRGIFDSITYRGMGSDIQHTRPGFMGALDSAKHYTKTQADFTLSGVYQTRVKDGQSPTNNEWHFHGLASGAHDAGGHILDFDGFEGDVEILPIREWQMSTRDKANRQFRPTEDHPDPVNISEVHRFPQRQLPVHPER